MKIPKGFRLVEKGGIEFISCTAINDRAGFLQAFTTRKGGCSAENYRSLNCGMNTGDDKKSVSSNIKRIEKAMNVKYASAANQVHGDRVVIIGPRHKVKQPGKSGFVSAAQLKKTAADGIITGNPGAAAAVRLADCVGTVIIDPVKNVAASVHSGWKGVANEIAVKAVMKMKEHFGSNPADMIAAISPAIGPCCYEVGRDLYNQLQKEAVFSNIFLEKKGRIYMDLWKGAENLLLKAGLKRKNIHTCRLCTSCNPEYFYSHRRDKGVTGRQMAIGAVLGQVVKPKAKRQK